MTDKPQFPAPHSLANPLMRDQPLSHSIIVSPGPSDLAAGLRDLIRSIEANDIPPIEEGGASKIARDPRPRLFGAGVVSTGGRKTLGSRLTEIGRSARKFLGSVGGRGEGSSR